METRPIPVGSQGESHEKSVFAEDVRRQARRHQAPRASPLTFTTSQLTFKFAADICLIPHIILLTRHSTLTLHSVTFQTDFS